MKIFKKAQENRVKTLKEKWDDESDIFPTGDRFKIWIEEGGEEKWAVYVAGEEGKQLICVTDREGAEKVQSLVENFAERLIMEHGRAEAFKQEHCDAMSKVGA